ncbi:hypothetical protein [Desulfarculus baarsii]
MSAIGSYGNMSQQDVTALSAQLVEEAAKASTMIRAFSRANEIIQDPEKAGVSLRESMQATARFTVEVLNQDLKNKLGKGLNVDTQA